MTTDLVTTMAFGRLGGPRRLAGHHTPDRLATGLDDDRRIGRHLVVDSFTSLAGVARHWSQRASDPSVIRPVRLARLDPSSVRRLRLHYRWWDQWIGRAVARRGLLHPMLIATNPFVAAFAPRRWASQTVYYAIDDWSAHHGHERWRHAHDAAMVEIRRAGMPVVAVSDHLLQQIAPSGPTLVLPNGIDPEEWRVPADPPPWMGGRPRPWLVYVGRLDERIDVAGLVALAEADLGTVFLVGPASAKVRALLDGLNGVVLPGPVDRPTVVGAVAGADVCIVPHVRNALTASMSPLKLFEYLAAGRPVAARRLPPIEALMAEGAIEVYDEPSELPTAIGRALMRAVPVEQEQRLDVLDRWSWSSRFHQLVGFALETAALR